MGDSKHDQSSDHGKKYVSRLQKGGALLDDMRQLVRFWSQDAGEAERKQVVVDNVLGKNSRSRSADVYRRAFAPRFLHGNPKDAWRIVQPLEKLDAAPEISTPIYYWISARSDALMYDFVTDELRSRLNGDPSIRKDETIRWINRTLLTHGQQWSDAVSDRVARGLLAALRDFGILEGTVNKRLAPQYLPTESFAYIAYALHELGSSGIELQRHSDWSLFLMTQSVVERMFLDAHQRDYLRYEAAGNLVRIDFDAAGYEEMAHVII